MHFWPKFGNTDFNWWWLIARNSSKWGKFWLLSSIWPWSSRSIVPRSNRDLNQGLLHLWSKFGDSSLNSWWVIARTSWWLTDRHTRTHTRRQRQYPKAITGPSLDQVLPDLTSFWPMGKPIWGKWANNWQCTTTGLDKSMELQMGHIHPAVSEICDPQSLDPICGKFDKFLAHGQAHMGQIG